MKGQLVHPSHEKLSKYVLFLISGVNSRKYPVQVIPQLLFWCSPFLVLQKRQKRCLYWKLRLFFIQK